jgi:hypothetical protein
MLSLPAAVEGRKSCFEKGGVVEEGDGGTIRWDFDYIEVFAGLDIGDGGCRCHPLLQGLISTVQGVYMEVGGIRDYFPKSGHSLEQMR